MNSFITKKEICTGVLNTLYKKMTRSIKVFLMLFLIVGFLIPTDVNAQITIDGNPSDWGAYLATSGGIKARIVDPIDNSTDDIWTQGSADPQLISSWRYTLGGANDKNNIQNAGYALIGQKVYFFADRHANNGDAALGFWLLQSPVAKVAGGVFSGVHTDGDILLISHFTNGGTVPEIQAFKWVGSSPGALDPTPIPVMGVTLGAAVNTSAVASPWIYNPKSGPDNVYGERTFFEGFVDLDLLPGKISVCVATFVAETRNSQSLTASLEDLVIARFGSVPNVPTLTGNSICSNTPNTGTISIANSESGVSYQLKNSPSPNGSDVQTAKAGNGGTLTWTGLAAGSYYILATNTTSGCNSISSDGIVVESATPDAPALGSVQPTCTVATGTVTITSSTSGLTFSVNGGDFAAYPVGGYKNLASGNYSVRAQNGSGCISSATSMTINAQPATPAKPTVSVTQPTCTVSTGQVCVTAPLDGIGIDYEYSNGGAYQDGLCFTVAAGGSYSITARIKGGTCVSTSTTGTLITPICIVCSYTQGFWGNKNGLTKLTVSGILKSDLVIGTGPNSVTITSTSTMKLNNSLPGGGTPGPLANVGGCNIADVCFDKNYLTRQGRINNNLLSQTITLSLNVRVNDVLNNIPIKSNCLITSGGAYKIDPSVVTYLTCKGQATVEGLLVLANAVLGGELKPGQTSEGCIVPSYSAINSAVDLFNNAFDECKNYMGYSDCPVARTSDASVVTDKEEIVPISLKVTTFPNPYTDNVTFKIDSDISGRAVLEVYNLAGQKLKTVFEGNIIAGKGQTIRFAVSEFSKSSLLYRLRVGNKTATGIVIHAK